MFIIQNDYINTLFEIDGLYSTNYKVIETLLTKFTKYRSLTFFSLQVDEVRLETDSLKIKQKEISQVIRNMYQLFSQVGNHLPKDINN